MSLCQFISRFLMVTIASISLSITTAEAQSLAGIWRGKAQCADGELPLEFKINRSGVYGGEWSIEAKIGPAPSGDTYRLGSGPVKGRDIVLAETGGGKRKDWLTGTITGNKGTGVMDYAPHPTPCRWEATNAEPWSALIVDTSAAKPMTVEAFLTALHLDELETLKRLEGKRLFIRGGVEKYDDQGLILERPRQFLSGVLCTPTDSRAAARMKTLAAGTEVTVVGTVKNSGFAVSLASCAVAP